jgi:hypothetical protein
MNNKIIYKWGMNAMPFPVGGGHKVASGIFFAS